MSQNAAETVSSQFERFRHGELKTDVQVANHLKGCMIRALKKSDKINKLATEGSKAVIVLGVLALAGVSTLLLGSLSDPSPFPTNGFAKLVYDYTEPLIITSGISAIAAIVLGYYSYIVGENTEKLSKNILGRIDTLETGVKEEASYYQGREAKFSDNLKSFIMHQYLFLAEISNSDYYKL